MKEREMLTLDEALSRVLGTAPEVMLERVPLPESLGRVLAEDVRSEADVPAAAVSAMDGFGVRAADLEGPGVALELIGDALAGRPFDGQLAPGTCTRVMTGGLVPGGCDAIVPVEKTSGYEPQEGNRIVFEAKAELGANIRPRGSVCARGDLLLSRGTWITAAGVGVLAQQGRPRVEVSKRPRVAVLPTGDEIVEVDEAPTEGQVRNSNAYALEAQIQRSGAAARRLPILRDREGATRDRLRDALAAHELVCTIGGVSMGTRDLVRGAFEDLGGRTLVESTRIKPGKPTLFGAVEIDGQDRYLLGLPGNPASSFTIFELFGAPWIRKALGLPAESWLPRADARITTGSIRKNWRLQLVPATLRIKGGREELEVLTQRSSADLFSLADADVLILAPADEGPQVGDLVSYLRLP